MTAPAQRSQHLPSLDGLRACAITLVIISHLSATTHTPFTVPFGIVGDIGNLGVRIFFVLSGFLITFLLLREEERTGRISLRKFYLRRVLRIFPAFYTFIGLMILAVHLGWVEIAGRDQVAASTFTANFQRGRGWYLGHTWSLAVEEQFYLLWPALFLLAGRRWRLAAVAAAIVAAPIVRIGIFLLAPDWIPAIGEVFPTIMDTIAVGAALALVRPWLQRQSWYMRALGSHLCYALPLLVIADAAFIYHFAWPGWLFGASALNLLIGFGIDRALTHPTGAVGRVLNLRVVAWLGTLSYSLYLWQQPFMARHSTRLVQEFPLNIVAALLCAMASYYIIERPGVWLKNRIGRPMRPAVRHA